MTRDAPVQGSSSAWLPREPSFGNFTALGHSAGPGGAIHGPRFQGPWPAAIPARHRFQVQPLLPVPLPPTFSTGCLQGAAASPLANPTSPHSGGVCPPAFHPRRRWFRGTGWVLSCCASWGADTATKDHSSAAHSLPFLEPEAKVPAPSRLLQLPGWPPVLGLWLQNASALVSAPVITGRPPVGLRPHSPLRRSPVRLDQGPPSLIASCYPDCTCKQPGSKYRLVPRHHGLGLNAAAFGGHSAAPARRRQQRRLQFT